MNKRSSILTVSCPIVLGLSLAGCAGLPDLPELDAAGRDGGAGALDGGAGTETEALRTPCEPDETAPVPVARCTTKPGDTSLPACGTWVKVELPGTVCGDGSQYKFFVNYSALSNNLLVSFEPGGACWDYDSCTGNGGTRGAANPHGIPDDHMQEYQYLNLHRRSPDNPAEQYNMVFIPYCTGDTHTGNKTAIYEGMPKSGERAGQPDTITYRHAGHANTLAVVAWIKKTFATEVSVPKLLVTGCSAGGAGALQNYHAIRRELGTGVQCGYLLDDSGPIFHSEGPSKQLHAKIREAWNVDPLLEELASELSIEPAELKEDFGRMNAALAKKYPRDRLSLVAYQRDLNYSLYSYQRFFPGATEEDIHTKWMQDLMRLMQTFGEHENLAYFLPYFRSDNCSHCVSIPPLGNPPSEPLDTNKVLTKPWEGTSIPELDIDLQQFTRELLDDRVPLKSYVGAESERARFSEEVAAACMKGG